MNTVNSQEEIKNQFDSRGKFLPGNKISKGKGRPLGSKTKVMYALENIILDKATGIVRKAVEMAIAGDTTCLKLCMDRILPVRKDRHIHIKTVEMKDSGDAVIVMSDLTKSVMEGEITPNEGVTAAGLIESYRKTIEIENLNKRIEQLESIMRNGSIEST